MNFQEAKKLIDNGSKIRRQKWGNSLLYVEKDDKKILWLYYRINNRIDKILFIKDGLNMQTDWEEVLI